VENPQNLKLYRLGEFRTRWHLLRQKGKAGAKWSKKQVKPKPKAQPPAVHPPRRTRFKKTETKRLIRAMRESGLSIARVECDATGRISIIPGAPEPPTDQNPWDAVLTK
jgi:hypothetical protein